MKLWFYLVGLGLTTSSLALTTHQKIDALSRRIEELEKSQSEYHFRENGPKVNSFLNNNLTIGGFFEPGYTVLSGKDTAFQAGTSNILALNISAEFESGIRFHSQVFSDHGVSLTNPHNNPNVPAPYPAERTYSRIFTNTLLTQGIIEYSFKRSLNIQGGLGYAPFGYVFQERELVLFLRRGGPQALRVSSDLLSPLWEGVHIHGSFPSKNNSWGYNAYTFTPPKKLTALGGGARFWFANYNEEVVAGLSTQIAKGPRDTSETIGADFKIDLFPFTLRSELFKQFAEGSDLWSFYVEPAVYTLNEEFLFYVFGDYFHNPQNETVPSVRDPYSKWEYGGGVNWLPTSFTRFRLGFTIHDYVGKDAILSGQNRDYLSLDISAGVAF